MRPLLFICLSALFVASGPAFAQTLDEANRLIEKKEYEKARTILEKLAGESNTGAEDRLAEMYIRPIGIPRNTQRAFTLYESAARKGNAEAQFLLAVEFLKGDLVKPNRKRALSLLSTSAKLKYANAQIGLCKELSSEDDKAFDAIESYAWCEAASKKSHRQAGEAGKRAKEILKKIEAKKSPEELQAAKQRADKYSKVY